MERDDYTVAVVARMKRHARLLVQDGALWQYDLARSTFTLLPREAQRGFAQPAVAPDGSWVVFSYRSEHKMMAVSVSGDPAPTPSAPAVLFEPLNLFLTPDAAPPAAPPPDESSAGGVQVLAVAPFRHRDCPPCVLDRSCPAWPR